MPFSPCCPWRSVWLARAVALVALVVVVPLFLRTPPWCDLTLYQMAARNILNGGTHYKDIFDTNLPGFVWALTVIQWVFGESVVAVRAADLLIVTGIVCLLDRIAKWGGATLASRGWMIAGVAVFYPFTVEMSHAQRDTWMALPGLAGVALRVRRGMGREEPLPPTPSPKKGGGAAPNTADREASLVLSPSLFRGGVGSSLFRPSLLEGLLWGAALWVKPHIVIMAATVWVLTARRLASEHPRPWRAAGADLLGNLLGGLVVGAAGVAWLFAYGTWAPFVDVFTNWNPGYLELVEREREDREGQQLYWFPPWSLGLLLTVPLALVSVLDMTPWSGRVAANARPERAGFVGHWLPRLLWDKQAGTDSRFARGVLGGLYLGWVAQAFFLQRGFEYAHIPETLLMLGVWASHRWTWVVVVLLWLVATTGVWSLAGHNAGARNELDNMPKKAREHYVPRHPIFDSNRLRLWPTCWCPDLTDNERYALWDKLRLHPPHEAVIYWEELAEVAEFLRSHGAKDYEVIAWFDSPHAIYLTMNLKPGVRFMHVNTAMSIGQNRTDETSGCAKVMSELADLNKTGRARFVISDLEWVVLSASRDEQRVMWTGPPRDPPRDLMPVATPYPDEFPFNQPTVFRSRGGHGRYIVHTVVTREHGPKK